MNKKQRKKYKAGVLKLKAAIDETAADLRRRFPNLDVSVSGGLIGVDKKASRKVRGVL